MFICRILLATIRNLGHRLCPRCLTLKSDVHAVGTLDGFNYMQEHPRVDSDSWLRRRILQARRFIFSRGLGISSKQVENKLKEYSLVPVEVCTLNLT
jgi:hypothetical protein